MHEELGPEHHILSGIRILHTTHPHCRTKEKLSVQRSSHARLFPASDSSGLQALVYQLRTMNWSIYDVFRSFFEAVQCVSYCGRPAKYRATHCAGIRHTQASLHRTFCAGACTQYIQSWIVLLLVCYPGKKWFLLPFHG